MQIDVTQEDIDRGIPREGENCPIALALKRATDITWQVDRLSAMCLGDPWLRKILLPKQAVDFISDFDLDKTVGAFTFDFPWEPQP